VLFAPASFLPPSSSSLPLMQEEEGRRRRKYVSGRNDRRVRCPSGCDRYLRASAQRFDMIYPGDAATPVECRASVWWRGSSLVGMQARSAAHCYARWRTVEPGVKSSGSFARERALPPMESCRDVRIEEMTGERNVAVGSERYGVRRLQTVHYERRASPRRSSGVARRAFEYRARTSASPGNRQRVCRQRCAV